ncbi:unnamed protein product [Rotaria sp. Silwood2]|nr:unnamed protein product [Rotaria sp. Silwood2]CAF3934121.1 unnamed protein product [Rotaria sp. Silwood2]
MTIKSYFVDNINHRRYPLNGVIPSGRQPTETHANKLFQNRVIVGALKLPPKVDLRPDMTTVENQYTANSCVANSLAGSYEYLLKKSYSTQIDVSRLFIYYNARYRDNPSGEITDSGCMIDEAISALSEYGTCLESLWPYELLSVNIQPSAEAYESAKYHTIVDWLQVKINLKEMKAALAQGYPFIFGAELFNSFSMATQSGVVPVPTATERIYHFEFFSYHAMLAVGYSDRSQMFIVRNSWGPEWGDQGYCYIPYAYLADPSLCFDAWVIRKLATDDFSQHGWFFQDTVNFRTKNNANNYTPARAAQNNAIIYVEEPDDHQEVTNTAEAQPTLHKE